MNNEIHRLLWSAYIAEYLCHIDCKSIRIIFNLFSKGRSAHDTFLHHLQKQHCRLAIAPRDDTLSDETFQYILCSNSTDSFLSKVTN
jgi:hypothetical protein